MENSIALLKDCIENRAPILFLGAGFSLGAKGKSGHNLILGSDLSQHLYSQIIIPNQKSLPDYLLAKAEFANKWKDLQSICDVLREGNLLNERNHYLYNEFSECSYDDSPYYSYLPKVDWKYIFTLNIDDLVEHIYDSESKPLLCWNNSSDKYEDDFNKTVLIKLHGDVKNSSTYVFDEKEYLAFGSSDNWMLRKFADLYISHDVIIIGTQFQERDIEIALQKVFDYGCDNSNFNYFFISPGTFKGKVQAAIESSKNFHHIKWDTQTFLEFLQENVSKPKGAIQNLCSQGITYWNEALQNARSQKECWDLYQGTPSTATDFYFNIDIAHPNIQNKIEEFLKSDNRIGFIEIKGIPYVGKTCIAKRALTIGVAQLFKSFYCVKTDIQYLQVLDQFLESASTSDSFIFCFEDASSYYRSLVKIANNHKNHVKRLFFIVTTSDTTQGPHDYVFGAVPFLPIVVSEKVNNTLAKSIYDKLQEKSQLGKLLTYGNKKSEIVKFIKHINDLIDVLYVAHRGERFSKYFSTWIDIHRSDSLFPVFQAVTLLYAMGLPNISIIYLPEIALPLGCNTFNLSKFVQYFGEFCYEEDGLLRLRCSRLITDTVLPNLAVTSRCKTIRSLVFSLSKELTERDRSFKNEIFKHLIRASILKQIVSLDSEQAIDFLIDLKPHCKHLSYYWIQLGILYRTANKFEDAENAFEYAKSVHGSENYQIAHTAAKNYMEWGLWAINNVPSQASALFEEGSKNMLQLIWRWPYPDAVCFSAHTYIDMNIKYYNKLNQAPPESTWKAMNTCMIKYVYNANVVEKLLRELFDKLCQFGKKYNLQIDQEKALSDILGHSGKIAMHPEVAWQIEDALPPYEE